ncbi:ABC transporter ATP-binding protein [Thomasclavelia spiroformis]|uniref:ABC transporter ATP-binding protein n=1 Tax=Thomasclavelia spiroformis TaxID=29348 RepID=UPI00242B3C57|nr:ABC transporter ATP-binding protein [Thomasclavelia spiroformis]
MIEIKNIHLQIHDKVLLKNEQLNINEGYIYVISGKSGCGKTTLLYVISLLSNYSNTIYHWDDQRIDNLSDEKIAMIRKNQIGYILQDLELISENLTLRDNIKCMFALINKKDDWAKVDEYMHKMNLDGLLDQKIDELSRGQRQRFALVLALIKDAKLIILDEPTSSLDKDNTIKLMVYLQIIAKKYHKMIVIASHDRYVKNNCDVLYEIENCHLVLKTQASIKENVSMLKNDAKISNVFYKIYNKSNYKVTKLLMKLIYMIMIIAICIGPAILTMYINEIKQLYDQYASNEIIAVNSDENLLNVLYDGKANVFSIERINMLKEIEHVIDVDYYWQLEGVLNFGKDTKNITVIPKKDLDKIAIPSSLANKTTKNMSLSMMLSVENQIYEFKTTIDDYIVKDYLISENIDNEVIFLPDKLIDKLFLQQNITNSASVVVRCDNVDNIENTMTKITNWLPEVTVLSNGTKYKEQLDNLQNIEQLINLLRIVTIIGIIVIVYIIQIMENKSRIKEIANLRINGITEKMFYKLYYYENRFVILATIISCVMGYIMALSYFKSSLVLSNLLLILLQSILCLLISQIIPLIISSRQIFTKDIAKILRDN